MPTPVGDVALTGAFIEHVAADRSQRRERFARSIVPTLRAQPMLPAAPSAAEAEARILEAIAGAGGRVLRLDDGRRTVELALVRTPIGDVALTGNFIRHVAVSRARQRERLAEQIVPTLSDPVEVWLQATLKPDGRIAFEPAFVGDNGIFVVAQEHRDGTVGWTFYPARHIERRRRGYLLYRRRGV